jgi:Ca-activated chloride channel family protein
MLNNISFEYPYVYLFIILYILCNTFCKKKKTTILFPNIGKVNNSINTFDYINIIKHILFIFLLIALSSPVQENKIKIQNNKGYEISLILDASGSMEQYNKFNIVKNVISDFVSKRKNDKLGLSIFADFAYVAIPLTYDKESVKRLLDRLQVGIAGTRQTALYEALFLSSNLFKTSKSKNKIAILLTDGVNNVDTIPLDKAINKALKYGIKVYVVGVGDNREINKKVLKNIALKTGGKFYQATSGQQIEDIYKEIDKLEKSKIKTNVYIKKTYYYQYPLLATILLSIILLLITRKRKIL